ELARVEATLLGPRVELLEDGLVDPVRGGARVDVAQVRRLAGAELRGHRGRVVGRDRLVVESDVGIGGLERVEGRVKGVALGAGRLPAREDDGSGDALRVEGARRRR